MEDEAILQRLVIASLEAAERMLKEHQTVIPFGVRASADTEDVKISCYHEKLPGADWQELIDHTVGKLKEHVASEDVHSTAIVTTLEADERSAIGIQIETPAGSKLFIYPFFLNGSEGVSIDEPIQSEGQIAGRVFEPTTGA